MRKTAETVRIAASVVLLATAIFSSSLQPGIPVGCEQRGPDCPANGGATMSEEEFSHDSFIARKDRTGQLFPNRWQGFTSCCGASR